MNERAGPGLAVVIGAASGMGAAVARRLRADGYRLVLADLALERLLPLAEELQAAAHAVDVCRPESIAALAGACGEGVDALVNSAGLSASMASFAKIVDVNLGGSANVLTGLIDVMRQGSAMVCFASMAGHLTGPVSDEVEAILTSAPAAGLGARLEAALPLESRINGVAYALSKFGVLKLAQRYGARWGHRGVRVNSISPGIIDTPMGRLEGEANRATTEQAVAAAPIPRLGAPEELAAVAAFLCSADAAYITATDIVVDGGWLGAMRAEKDSPFAQALNAAREKGK